MILRLYSLLWRIGLLPAWIWWAWRSRGQTGPGEKGRWRERLAWCSYPLEAQDGLLLHAASIGEAVAAVELLRALREAEPDLPVLVTCTSYTGAQRLRRDLGAGVAQAFLPFDTPGAMTRLLDRVRPRIIVLMETELWPNLLAAARQRAIPVVLANARLSARSARRYAQLLPLSLPMLRGVNQVLAQTRHIARRFQRLGVPAERLIVAGNLKFDLQVPPIARQRASHWRQQIGSRLVVVAASTHPGEDEAMLQAWAAVLLRHPGALLVLVPRHPQRFDDVARLVIENRFALLRHSQGQVPQNDRADGTQIWLADTVGEMLTWMALADVAFIGGSLVPHGGHNPIEAMVFGCPVVSGRCVHNFADIYRSLDRDRAVAWVGRRDVAAITEVLDGLLGNAFERERLGEGGRRVYEANAGTANRCVQVVSGVLQQTQGQRNC